MYHLDRYAPEGIQYLFFQPMTQVIARSSTCPRQRATPSDNLMWGFSVKFYPTHTARAKPEAQATSQTDLGAHMRAELLDSDFQS
jgi:hypothetical protein